ncbi:hypothetical protein [Mucilaginibacter lacusdianchii]|uniref:hypothetical protein n=1 Tax=Mucilaginibacter lacusdianchii TaxID=2684211 RepID=UPI00131C372A|nr:hypothetical protein [Mucilaginibacter sp. JXJ CY 39]
MEAVYIKNNSGSPSWKTVLETFFKRNSPESVQLLFWRMFQCWVTRDCALRGGMSDEEVAVAFDQLIEFVSAAYTHHQAQSPSGNPQSS